VPPAIPAIHGDLPLNETDVGALTSLPTLLLGLAAIPGALLIARLGARRALIAGLLTVGVASALRGLGPSVVLLFAATFVMGVGVAVSQPALPTLTRQWFPARVGLATTVYSNGLLMGEAVPASLTGTALLPALRGSWEWAFAAWAAPVLLTAGLVLLHGPAEAPQAPDAPPARWWPNFRNRSIWQIGLMMGFASATYFGVNAFLPDYVTATGRPDLKDAALTALNVSQLPASFLMVAIADRLLLRRWPFVLIAVVMTAAMLAMLASPAWVVVWSAVNGFVVAFAFILTWALPPLLAAPADVARFSAGVFLVQYLATFVGPVVGGAAWDVSRNPAAAFLTLAGGGVLTLALAATLDVGPRAPSPPGEGRAGRGLSST
jgi:CP family cyanate transporter-like MFS transporter